MYHHSLQIFSTVQNANRVNTVDLQKSPVLSRTHTAFSFSTVEWISMMHTISLCMRLKKIQRQAVTRPIPTHNMSRTNDICTASSPHTLCAYISKAEGMDPCHRHMPHRQCHRQQSRILWHCWSANSKTLCTIV